MLYLFRDERPEYSPGFGVEATALFNRLAESKLGLDDAISVRTDSQPLVTDIMLTIGSIRWWKN